MTIQGNLGALTGAADPEDITIGELLAALDGAAELPLVFSYDGQDVKPGYHVTEVKAGRFEALDCGANPESWTDENGGEKLGHGSGGMELLRAA